MRDLLWSIEFWVAMIAAVLIKTRTSPTMSPRERVLSAATGVAVALVFTAPIMEIAGLSGQNVTIAMACTIHITAEHVVREVINLRLADIIRAWRGK